MDNVKPDADCNADCNADRNADRNVGHGTLEDTLVRWRAGIEDNGGPIRLSGLAMHAMALSEAILSEEEARTHETGTLISCRKGCAACCRQVIPLSPPEAFLMAERLAESRQDAGSPWSDRFLKALGNLDRNGLGDAPLFDQAAKYFVLGMPCPFLEKESCSIHPHRPLACREHLILSEPEYCEDFASPFIRPLSLPVSIREALATVAAEVLGSAPEMIPLVRIEAWVTANKDAGQRVWDAGFLLDKLMQRVRSRW